MTGICSIWWPGTSGQRRSILTVSVNAGLTLGGAAVILLLKPLLTALFLRAGAVGGMITPALATGAAAGSVVALALNHLAGTDIQVVGAVVDVRGGRAGDHPARAGVRGAVRVGARPAAVVAADGVRGRGLRCSRLRVMRERHEAAVAD